MLHVKDIARSLIYGASSTQLTNLWLSSCNLPRRAAMKVFKGINRCFKGPSSLLRKVEMGDECYIFGSSPALFYILTEGLNSSIPSGKVLEVGLSETSRKLFWKTEVVLLLLQRRLPRYSRHNFRFFCAITSDHVLMAGTRLHYNWSQQRWWYYLTSRRWTESSRGFLWRLVQEKQSVKI